MNDIKQVVDAIGIDNIKDIKISLNQKGMLNLQRAIRESIKENSFIGNDMECQGLSVNRLLIDLKVVKDE